MGSRGFLGLLISNPKSKLENSKRWNLNAKNYLICMKLYTREVL